MKSCFSFFKLKFISGLQYRAAAISAILCQFFFGFVFISVYYAFYQSGNTSSLMDFKKLVSYTWLNQAFYALVYIWYRDKEIISCIKNGNISYELCRPQNIYFMWYSKILGKKISACLLRCIPILVIANFLPFPYTLDLSITFERLIIFIIIFILSIILMNSIITLAHVLCIITIDDQGIVNMLMIVADILSGLGLPISFFPGIFKTIAYSLPFRYVCDFPFRFYVGDISIQEGLFGIIIQLVWIVVIIIFGLIITNKGLKKVVVQGG